MMKVFSRQLPIVCSVYLMVRPKESAGRFADLNAGSAGDWDDGGRHREATWISGKKSLWKIHF